MSAVAAGIRAAALRDTDAPAAAATGPMLLRRLAGNTLAIGAGGLGALFTLLVARLLGKEALGGFMLAWATADLLSKVGTLGLDQGTTALMARRRAAGDVGGAHAVFRLALGAGLALSALVAGVAWLALGWLGQLGGQTPELLAGQRVMLLALPAIALYRIATGASRGLGIMTHDALSGGLVHSLTKAFAVVAFAWLGLPLVIGGTLTAVFSHVSAFVAGGAVAYVLARRALAESAGLGGKADARALLPLSLAAAVTTLANLAMQRMDVLVLGFFVGRVPGLDAAALGVYCAAGEIAGLTRKVRFAAEPPFLHAVATAQGRGRRDEERSVVGSIARWTLPMSLFLAGGLALGAPLWLSLFGPGFEQGAWLVTLLVVAHSIGSQSGLAENVLLLRRPALNVVNLAVGLATNGVLCLVLVPKMGPAGAAVAAVGGYGVLAALRFGELHALGAPWPWWRLRGAAVAFVAALAPALVLRALVPGTSGAAWAAAGFTALFVAALWRWASEDGDGEALSAIAPVPPPGVRRLGDRPPGVRSAESPKAARRFRWARRVGRCTVEAVARHGGETDDGDSRGRVRGRRRRGALLVPARARPPALRNPPGRGPAPRGTAVAPAPRRRHPRRGRARPARRPHAPRRPAGERVGGARKPARRAARRVAAAGAR